MIDQPTWGAASGLADLRLLRREIERIGNPEATLALLVLLTMQAPRNVAEMDWSDIDLPEGRWTLARRPHKVALLSSAVISTLITRARTGVARAGPSVHDRDGRQLLDPVANSRWLRGIVPAGAVPWTLEAVHQTAVFEWTRLLGRDLLPVIMIANEAGRLAEQIRRRHAIRFALGKWARALR